MTAPYLSLEAVRMDFAVDGKACCAVRDIDLAIDKGEVVSIIGHSGCGKSTLLNIVAGLLSGSEGVVILDGKEVDGPGPDRAVVFQNHSLLPWLSAYDNVRLAVDKVFRGRKSAAERHAWTEHNLRLVHMDHAARKHPGRALGRHAPADRHRARARDGAEGAADGRAVRRARRADRAPPQDTLMEIQGRLRNTVITITHDVDEGGAARGPRRDDDERPRRRRSARCCASTCRARASGSS
jgi:nitrate/nitrite transport system ATP-binding protein